MAILEAGTRAPEFALDDTEGVAHTLESAARDGLALLAFFALDCRACDVSYLFWDRMAEAYADAGCPILAISLDSSEAAADFYERSGVSFTVLVGGDRSVARAYGIDCTPSLFLADAEGKILASHDAFDRAALNALSVTIAERLGVPPVMLENGEAPEFVPGCALHLEG